MSDKLDDFLENHKCSPIGEPNIGNSSEGLNTHKVMFPDGTIQYREFVKKKPAAIVLAKTKDGKIICIGKPAANCSEGALIKLPSVDLEVEENEEETKANLRILLKDLGFEAREITPIGFHYQDPELSGERVYEYCAIDCCKVSEQESDMEKNKQTILLSPEEIEKAIIKNQFLDASSLIAYMRVLLNEEIHNYKGQDNDKLDEILEKCKCTQLGETQQGGSFYKLMERMVELPDGTIQKIQFVKKKPAAIVLAITKNNEFVCIVQPIANCSEGVLPEFPAGYLEETEEATKAALRELLEETGFETKKVICLGYHYQDSDLNGERVYGYCALDCNQVSEQVLDKGEYIKTVLLSQEEIKKAIISGKLLDANSLIVFMKMLLFRERIQGLEKGKETKANKNIDLIHE